MCRRSKNKAGMTLIEAMVAMVIFAVVSSAIILLTLQLLSTAFSARLKNQGTTYGEQMIEQVRGYYQTNGWAALSAQARPAPGRCLSSISPWTEISSCPNYPPTTSADCLVSQISGTNFYRYLLLQSNSSNYNVYAKVVTCWQEKTDFHSTVIESYFYSY